MKIIEFINKHFALIFLAIIEGVALFAIICAIVAHHMSTPFSWGWFLCFECPLYAFIIWVWCKAIIPWSLNIIDMEERRNHD